MYVRRPSRLSLTALLPTHLVSSVIVNKALCASLVLIVNYIEVKFRCAVSPLPNALLFPALAHTLQNSWLLPEMCEPTAPRLFHVHYIYIQNYQWKHTCEPIYKCKRWGLRPLYLSVRTEMMIA